LALSIKNIPDGFPGIHLAVQFNLGSQHETTLPWLLFIKKEMPFFFSRTNAACLFICLIINQETIFSFGHQSSAEKKQKLKY